VVVKVAKFIRQNVGVRSKVKCSLSKPFLKAHNIEAETILACNLKTARKMIDLLVLV